MNPAGVLPTRVTGHPPPERPIRRLLRSRPPPPFPLPGRTGPRDRVFPPAPRTRGALLPTPVPPPPPPPPPGTPPLPPTPPAPPALPHPHRGTHHRPRADTAPRPRCPRGPPPTDRSTALLRHRPHGAVVASRRGWPWRECSSWR